MKLIDKDTLVAEIKKRINFNEKLNAHSRLDECNAILSFLDTLEVIDPYEQCIQYASIESGIKAHAEDYSFNIESELFNQLTKEQQKLWRKEIEQACISGGYSGLNLAKDPRYKENLEVKEVVRINTSLSDIDDDLKKLGVDPDSKQAKMLKDCYYRAIDRILEKGEEYARHG